MFCGVGDRVSHHLCGDGPLTVTVSAGPTTIRYEFAFDVGKPGSGGTGRINVNGKKVAEELIGHLLLDIAGYIKTMRREVVMLVFSLKAGRMSHRFGLL